MLLSEIVQKPSKNGSPAWKGTPEMKSDADTKVWPEWLEFLDELENYSALELMVFVQSWYLKIGYANLGKMIVAGVKAVAIQRASEPQPE